MSESDKRSYVSFRRSWWSSTATVGFPTVTRNGTSGAIQTNYVEYGPNQPDWRTKLKMGINCTTPAEGAKHLMPKNAPVSYSSVNAVAGVTHVGSGYPTTLAFLNGSGIATSIAATKATHAFTKSYTSKTTKWQSGVFLGELKELAGFLKNPVRHLYRATDDLASRLKRLKTKHRPRSSRSAAKVYGAALADTWLAYAFAVRPLCQDADDAATALRAFSEGRTHDIIPVYGTGSHETSSNIGANESVGFTGLANYCSRDRFEIQKATVVNRAGWKSDLPSGAISPLQTVGLTWLDVAPTLWELVPWSFVVDYFSNVGNVLDDLRLRHMTWAWQNSTSIRRRIHVSSAWRVPPINGNAKNVVRGGHQVAIHKSHSRSTGLFLSMNLILEVPGMERSRTWLNLAALTTKFLSSRP